MNDRMTKQISDVHARVYNMEKKFEAIKDIKESLDNIKKLLTPPPALKLE